MSGRGGAAAPALMLRGVRTTLEPTAEWQDATVLCEGLRFPEGPVAMPDGSILVSDDRGNRLIRVSYRQGK